MYVCMYACIFAKERATSCHPHVVCIAVCIYVCMYVCTHVCMYVFMYVCMYVCIHAHLQKKEQSAVTITFEVLRTCFDMPLHAAATKLVSHIYICTYVHIYIYIYIYINTHIHVSLSLSLSLCVSMYPRVCLSVPVHVSFELLLTCFETKHVSLFCGSIYMFNTCMYVCIYMPNT